MAWIATIEALAADAERLTDLFWREGADGVAEVEVAGAPDRVRLMAGFDEENEAAVALEHMGVDGTVSPVETGAWSNAETSAVQVAEHTLRIESGQAFGHGEHPTTRVCLDLVATHVEAGVRVLDVGTGTGVLAIAAAKLGASPVVGIDIDQATIDVARANASANGVTVELSTLSIATLARQSPGGFDVVVVNMLVAELEPIASDIVDATAADGVIILSGCLIEQADRAATAFAPFTECQRRQADEWMGLVLR